MKTDFALQELEVEYHVTVDWRRESSDYTYESYNRAHEWRFRSVHVPASAAPEFRGTPERVNPEEGFVAAISSCHMLTFLALAAKRRLSLDSYSDDAIGFMEKNEAGKLAITRAVLRPRIVWSKGVSVSADELKAMHHLSHENCFIASSVKTVIAVESQG